MASEVYNRLPRSDPKGREQFLKVFNVENGQEVRGPNEVITQGSQDAPFAPARSFLENRLRRWRLGSCYAFPGHKVIPLTFGIDGSSFAHLTDSWSMHPKDYSNSWSFGTLIRQLSRCNTRIPMPNRMLESTSGKTTFCLGTTFFTPMA
jgi:hypothetical protein